MRCQNCGEEITKDNYTYEKVLSHEGEEVLCVDCVEEYTYICVGCDERCDNTLYSVEEPRGGLPICQFCIDDGYFEED